MRYFSSEEGQKIQKTVHNFMYWTACRLQCCNYQVIIWSLKVFHVCKPHVEARLLFRNQVICMTTRDGICWRLKEDDEHELGSWEQEYNTTGCYRTWPKLIALWLHGLLWHGILHGTTAIAHTIGKWSAWGCKWRISCIHMEWMLFSLVM